MENLIKDVTTILKNKNKTISIAESCTGGFFSHKLTSIPGSSSYFKLGIIAYSNKAKINQLNITQDLLKKSGAVSEKVAILMAKNLQKISNTEISLSTTGIAGPTGGSSEKPVGLVYIGIVYKNKVRCKKIKLKGDRLENISNTVKEGFLMIKKLIQ